MRTPCTHRHTLTPTTTHHNTHAQRHQFCWNANSGDTGGLVDDTWKNLKWDKLTFLRDHYGLRGWAEQAAAAAEARRRRAA